MDATAEPRGIHRRLDFQVTNSLVQRFKARVVSSNPTECWLWQGAMRNGYGAVKVEGHIVSAHVLSYRISKGDIPDGLLVTHSCDNRACVNPAHLSLGTHSDNMREMQERRKIHAPRGEESSAAVLTNEKVKIIQAMRVATGRGSTFISKALGVKRSTVKGIIERTSWKHLEWPTPEEAKQIIKQLQDSPE